MEQIFESKISENLVRSEIIDDRDYKNPRIETHGVKRSEPKKKQQPKEAVQETNIYEEPVFKQTFGQEDCADNRPIKGVDAAMIREQRIAQIKKVIISFEH